MSTEQTEQLRWYSSKIDWWLGPVLCLPPATALWVCVSSALAGSMAGLLLGVVTTVLVGGIYFGLVFPMRYGLSDTHLIVRFGMCRRRIPLAEIREVHPTRNPLSSPALSLDRLRIRFDAGDTLKAVLISPSDRGRFLDELARKAGLKRERDRLFRV
jgi:hypothetical protein